MSFSDMPNPERPEFRPPIEGGDPLDVVDPFDAMMGLDDWGLDPDLVAEFEALDPYEGGALDDQRLTEASSTHQGTERITLDDISDDFLNELVFREQTPEEQARVAAADAAGRIGTAAAFNAFHQAIAEFQLWQNLEHDQAEAKRNADKETSKKDTKKKSPKKPVRHLSVVGANTTPRSSAPSLIDVGTKKAA